MILVLVLIVLIVGSVVFHLLSPWWFTPIASNWGYIDDTIVITFWITGVAFVAIISFMAYCVFRFRHRPETRAAYEPENKRLEWWLTVLTSLAVAGLLTPGLFVWNQFITVPAGADTIEIMAQQWQFNFRLPGKDGVLGTSDTRNVSSDNPFGLKPGVGQTLSGPFEWVALKSKYFVGAVIAPDTGSSGLGRIGGVQINPTSRTSPTLVADGWASLGVPSDGRFSYALYVGPMEYPRLRAVGHGFDDINPYGWAWLRPVIRPVAVGARWLLVAMHERLGLAYGLGLVVFGVLIRLVLWPLNQKAMRASMAMQAIQPVLKEIQDKHQNDPQRLQQEMFKVYKENKVNPFSGCWPLLLPWPIMIALFFVFQNSIELRGQQFLWIPDLSRPDPLYIIPVMMALSMFGVTKIGQMGMPPNPQMKMMLYMMPAMMLIMFLKFASGLNLYYAVQNLASIPQQWIVAKERLRKNPAPRPSAPAPLPALKKGSKR